jgi:hypothetical protein
MWVNMSALQFIISFLGGSAILLAAVAWLMKSLVTQWLAKDIENHKSKLQFESQTELTKFKAEIEKTAFEHQIIFSRLHDKRAEVIAELYAKIAMLYRTMTVFVRMALAVEEADRKNKLKDLWKAVDDFRGIYERNKIFFHANVCEKIEELDSAMSAPVSKLVMHLEMYEQNNDISPAVQAWEEGKQKIEEIVNVIKKELEDEFREILGVK